MTPNESSTVKIYPYWKSINQSSLFVIHSFFLPVFTAMLAVGDRRTWFLLGWRMSTGTGCSGYRCGKTSSRMACLLPRAILSFNSGRLGQDWKTDQMGSARAAKIKKRLYPSFDRQTVPDSVPRNFHLEEFFRSGFCVSCVFTKSRAGVGPTQP